MHIDGRHVGRVCANELHKFNSFRSVVTLQTRELNVGRRWCFERGGRNVSIGVKNLLHLYHKFSVGQSEVATVVKR